MGRWAGYWMLDDASEGKTRRHPYLYNEIFASLCRVNRLIRVAPKTFCSGFRVFLSYSGAVNAADK